MRCDAACAQLPPKKRERANGGKFAQPALVLITTILTCAFHCCCCCWRHCQMSRHSFWQAHTHKHTDTHIQTHFHCWLFLSLFRLKTPLHSAPTLPLSLTLSFSFYCCLPACSGISFALAACAILPSLSARIQCTFLGKYCKLLCIRLSAPTMRAAWVISSSSARGGYCCRAGTEAATEAETDTDTHTHRALYYLK